MPGRDIIVVGTSAGGVEALRMLVAGLPSELPASVFVVMHTASESPGILAEILDRSGKLPASNARNRECILRGRIYVAPPDHHLLIEPGIVRVTRGPKENRFRPAIDPLFRSAAQVYGPRVVGVILTGGLDDGTSGLWTVKQLGGAAIVQDPREALVASMPQSAMNQVKVDYCLPVMEIAPLLVRLASAPAVDEGAYQVPDELNIKVNIAKQDKGLEIGVEKLGAPSIFTCPDCHGTLLQLKEDERLRFRCHTGHAFSADSLLAELTDGIENSLWSTIRSIDESVMLMRHIADHVKDNNGTAAAEQFLEKAKEAERRSNLVRQAVFDHEKLSEERVKEEVSS